MYNEGKFVYAKKMPKTICNFGRVKSKIINLNS